MATVLDLGLFQFFSNLYPVIFVFAMVFAVLVKFKFPTDKLAVNAIIAVMMAFMVLLSQTLIDIINFMIPWFALAIVFLVLLLLLFQIMGATDQDFSAAVKDPAVMWTIIGVGLVIILASLGLVLGQDIGPYLGGDVNATGVGQSQVGTNDLQTNLMATFFHPKILGLFLVFAIGIFSIIFLSLDMVPKDKK